MFTKILIANRGEIACRVAATARRMGIRTVAVYSEADAGAKHVAVCDEAVCIGPAAAKESYLRAEKLIEVALATGAQAIHPGYGFLSENAEFAKACAEKGLVFIGPPASAIDAMGSKSAAKALMEKAGVPLVPGYHGDQQDTAFLNAQADAIGYPVLLKASAGGGGKGMRVVEKSEDFADALASCKREAINSFGDDKVLVEKYLQRPRHIEIQVFADTHGNCVYLFERDCSVQRRHQKVIEEACAPAIPRAEIEEIAGKVAAMVKGMGYDNIGTVEMLRGADGSFNFLEMNTRLQVEHGVTEKITGVDLVQAQAPFQLAPPLLRASSVFFTESATVIMAFAQPGAQIRYSFVHEQPGPDDSVYSEPLLVTAPMVTLHARSHAAGYRPSDAATLTLIKDGLPLATVNATPPHPRYPGSGPYTLYDNKSGLYSKLAVIV